MDVKFGPPIFYKKNTIDMMVDNPCEPLHMQFIRRLLGVRKSTPRLFLLNEVGRQPLYFVWAKQVVKFWNRLIQQNKFAKRNGGLPLDFLPVLYFTP